MVAKNHFWPLRHSIRILWSTNVAPLLVPWTPYIEAHAANTTHASSIYKMKIWLWFGEYYTTWPDHHPSRLPSWSSVHCKMVKMVRNTYAQIWKHSACKWYRKIASANHEYADIATSGHFMFFKGTALSDADGMRIALCLVHWRWKRWKRWIWWYAD